MKKYLMLFTGLFCLLTLTGCAMVEGQSQESDCIVTAWQARSLEPLPPQLYVFLDPDQEVRAVAWHMSYTVYDKDGNSVGGTKFDSPHHSELLLQDFYSATLQLSYGQDLPLGLQFIGMDFSYGYPPSRYPHIISATRWRLEDVSGDGLYLPAGCWYYGGESIELTAQEAWTPGVLVDVISVYDDGFDYIYVVEPEWREGQIRWRSLFAFRVNSGIMTMIPE